MSERGYTINRTFDAPRPAVWSAWTKPGDFATWWGGDDVDVDDVHLDVRPGGPWRATMHFENRDIHWRGEYREVDKPNRLVLTITDDTGGPDEFELFTVDLAGKPGDQTQMTLRQSGGHLSDEEYERAKAGTNSFLDSMDRILPAIKARHET
jgi:uncharacterized protein YndB with AHSA1/START domain